MVLAAVASCTTELYGEFAAAAEAFSVAADTAASAPTQENLDAAREAWKLAIALWQQAEPMRVGPAGPVTVPGGEGQRDLVYSWPLVSRCLTDQTIVSEAYEAPSFAQSALINVRGLDAAEYLLFYAGDANACSSSAAINANGTWAALGSAELAARRRAYAAVVAADLAVQGKDLHATWQAGFAAELGNAGAAGSSFGSEQIALNAISDGLFYLEREVKDLKLGKPLGLYECTEASCPEAVESQYALVSREHVANNLKGFQRIYAGCEASGGIGFDDLLRSLGAGSLADRMETNLQAAIGTAEGFPTSDLRAALSEHRTEFVALHAAVKKLADDLKTDFVTVLDLELPNIVEGDND
jgi:predicted lipoprotein